VLLQSLLILEGYRDDELDPQTELGAHHILEALKLALADREAYYGDPDPEAGERPVPMDVLLSPAYAAGRRALIADRASAEVRPGQIDSYVAFRAPLGEESAMQATAGAGEPTVSRSGVTRGDTCHIDVVDRWGNMISATPSGGWLQSSPHIPELGFCLGSRLQMNWLDESAPPLPESK